MRVKSIPKAAEQCFAALPSKRYCMVLWTLTYWYAWNLELC